MVLAAVLRWLQGLVLCFLTKSEQKRRKHTLAIMLQIIEMKNYKVNCFWQNSFLPRIEYQNVISIFPLTCHKFHSRWRLRSWFRMWTRRVQVMVTVTKVVRFINVLVTLLNKVYIKLVYSLNFYFIILMLVQLYNLVWLNLRTNTKE